MVIFKFKSGDLVNLTDDVRMTGVVVSQVSWWRGACYMVRVRNTEFLVPQDRLRLVAASFSRQRGWVADLDYSDITCYSTTFLPRAAA